MFFMIIYYHKLLIYPPPIFLKTGEKRFFHPIKGDYTRESRTFGAAINSYFFLQIT